MMSAIHSGIVCSGGLHSELSAMYPRKIKVTS